MKTGLPFTIDVNSRNYTKDYFLSFIVGNQLLKRINLFSLNSYYFTWTKFCGIVIKCLSKEITY